MFSASTLTGRREGEVTTETMVTDSPAPGILAEVEVHTSRPFPWLAVASVVVVGAIMVALLESLPERTSRRI
jgi:hypothetical protein